LRSGISFTRVWEDDEVDRRALAIGPGSRVVVVAGAGDRGLDAVVWGAGEVTAVDVEPAQLRLCALKVAAAGILESPDLVALFSIGRRPDAARLYRQRLRPKVTAGDRRYWDRHIGVFEAGLHQHRPVGLAMWVLGRLLRGIGGRRLQWIIDRAPDPATQARWYRQHLRARYWNRLTRWLLRRGSLLRWLVIHRGERDAMREEAFHEWLEAGIERSLETALIRENPYWMSLLSGSPVAPEHEEAWLRPNAIDALRRAPGVIRLRRVSIVDELASRAPGSVDAVALSNVPDWLDAAELERLWDALARALAPGGRAVLRSAFRTPPLPSGPAADVLRLDVGLSADATDRERTGIYAAVRVLVRTTGERGTG
jgi:S-adenosylmethionine-diacylglycerol 3-amino-3-carboxypropyl transferase